MASDSGAKLYDYLRIKHVGLEKVCRHMGDSEIPSTTFKDWKKQWVVLCSHRSPNDCSLTYCNREDEWLTNHDMQKLSLLKFDVSRHKQTKKTDNTVMEIMFAHYSLFMMFGSMSKLQEWFDALERIRRHVYAELVRSPKHPERERMYVIELCQDSLKFWLPDYKDIMSFEWKLTHIRRAEFHTIVGKLEIEVGRSSETGQGKFYFIGPDMQHFFKLLKEMIQLKSRSAIVKERGKDLLRRDVASYVDGLENEETDKPVITGSKSAATVHPVPPPPPGESSFSPEPPSISPSSSLPSVDSQSDDRSPKEDWKPKYNKPIPRLPSHGSEDDASISQGTAKHYMALTPKTRSLGETTYMDIKPSLLRRSSTEQPTTDYLDMSGSATPPPSDGNFNYDIPLSASVPNQINFPYSHSSSSSS